MSHSTTIGLPAWREQHRWMWTLAWIVPLLPFAGWLLFHLGDSEWAWWTGPLVLYGLVPVLDQLLGEDFANPPDAAMPSLAADRYYRLVLIAWLPLQLAALLLGCYIVVSTSPGWIGWLGLACTLGLVSGSGINVGHELGHKPDRWSRRLAQLALAPALYGHFLVEHNRGHHVHVATPQDPASARYGESFWRFLPRSMIGGLRSAWRLEAMRLAQLGLGSWNWRNRNLQGWSVSILLFGSCALIFGWACLPLLLAQALYGASTLESVNYIEHYGLLRRRDASGRYERCKPCHSWNSNRRVTNLLLYHLERHSDHHAHPLRPYQTLRHFEDSPQLPAGYAALVPLTYVPPLWFALMNPRVRRFYAGDVSRANRG